MQRAGGSRFWPKKSQEPGCILYTIPARRDDCIQKSPRAACFLYTTRPRKPPIVYNPSLAFVYNRRPGLYPLGVLPAYSNVLKVRTPSGGGGGPENVYKKRYTIRYRESVGVGYGIPKVEQKF